MDTLVIACCAPKLEYSAPALELYQNRAFNLVRKTEDIGERFQILILSAKHGLIPAHNVIAPYDQLMTDERMNELVQRKCAPLWLRDAPGEIYVYGGLRYRFVVRTWCKLIGRTPRELIGPNRGCGDHYSALCKVTA